ncbi:unnamed protein product [Protopolystoma xenopodis]|uniref:BHLH domain-containing protein n=1 Tax=Protopolystoma xenopodis TaxID=117903 RepID=A0A3S5BHC2_9PLAT|nr:unnamed protein product [Protopolystoma xenopodis]
MSSDSNAGSIATLIGRKRAWMACSEADRGQAKYLRPCEKDVVYHVQEDKGLHLLQDSMSGCSTIGGVGKRVSSERERTRTANVNDAFLLLRSLIPTEPVNRKLSKIETLRLAASYISHLHAILVTGSSGLEQPCLRHTMSPSCSTGQCLQAQMTLETVPATAVSAGLGGRQTVATHRPVCTFCMTEVKQHQRALNDQTVEIK